MLSDENKYLMPDLSIIEMRGISALGMAHVGDAVYELMVRTWLCTQGTSTAKKLHGEAVSYVSAKAQSAAAVKILPQLTDDERAVFKRGRNAHANNVPRSSTFEEYHISTGIEALFGHLYLNGQTARLEELFKLVTAKTDCSRDSGL